MSPSEPVAEVLRSFVWSCAVERHQRSRTTVQTDQLGPPVIDRDASDFDQISTTVDVLFESLNPHAAPRITRVNDALL